MSLPARRVDASLTAMTEYVLPTHANVLGTVFGGQILAWVDICAAVCAQRHSGHIAITAGIDELSFERPIRVGQVVRLMARVTATFRTSLEILVEVEGEEATTGARWTCVTAFVTCVALDETTRLPTDVPPIVCETAEQKALARAALDRRELRLAKRRARQPVSP